MTVTQRVRRNAVPSLAPEEMGSGLEDSFLNITGK